MAITDQQPAVKPPPRFSVPLKPMRVPFHSPLANCQTLLPGLAVPYVTAKSITPKICTELCAYDAVTAATAAIAMRVFFMMD